MKRNFLTYAIIFILGTVLIICSSIFLRTICIGQIKIKAEALQSNSQHIKANEDTPLYKTSKLEESEIILMIPRSYFAESLSNPNEEIIKVSYNNIVGFIKKTNNIEITSPTNEKLYWTSNLTTRSDAGTHLRTAPNTTSTSITIIPANTNLKFYGYIIGETPLDGTSNIWYYIDFESGPTTITRGYVYSERTILETPFIENNPPATIAPEEDINTQTGLIDISTDPASLTGAINLTSGVKWFLIILFTSLALIIFALLVLSPKQDKRHTRELENPPQKKNEEINYIQQTNQTKNSKTPSPPQKTRQTQLPIGRKQKKEQYKYQAYSEHANELTHLASRPIKFTNKINNFSKTSHEGNSILAKYFKVTHPDDDELL